MTLAEMKYVLEVAKCGSISLAAHNLGLSQPSLSRTLKALEKKLQVSLFNRLGRSLVLTEEGRVYHSHFINILQEMVEAERSVELMNDQYVEPVKISLHANYAKTLLPVLEPQVERASDLVVDYVLQGTNEGYTDLLNGLVDIAIVADVKTFPDIVKINLWKEYIGLFSCDGKPKDHIIFNPDMPLAPRILKSTQFKSHQKVTDYHVICSMLSATRKMGLLPAAFAKSNRKMKLVKKFPEVFISLIYHRGRTKTKAFKACVSLIKKVSQQISF